MFSSTYSSWISSLKFSQLILFCQGESAESRAGISRVSHDDWSERSELNPESILIVDKSKHITAKGLNCWKEYGKPWFCFFFNQLHFLCTRHPPRVLARFRVWKYSVSRRYCRLLCNQLLRSSRLLWFSWGTSIPRFWANKLRAPYLPCCGRSSQKLIK